MERLMTVMHTDIAWPNGMDGGTVIEHAALRDYWSRQWSLLDPRVEPLQIAAESDGRVAVTVHQLVDDLNGDLLRDAVLRHVYQFEEGLNKFMEIRELRPQVASKIPLQQGVQNEGSTHDHRASLQRTT
jgi:hypothetical protein